MPVLTESDKGKLRKYLKNKSEFAGWGKTAVEVLKKYKDDKIKAKKLGEYVLQIYRLSEEYESDDSSDSSDSDDDTPKTPKDVIKMLNSVKELKHDNRKFSLA